VFRPCSPWIADLIKQDTEKCIKNGWMRPGTGPYASPIVAAKQPAKGPDARRKCGDYTRLNESRCAEECRFPVKSQAKVTARLAGSTIFCTLDLCSGYHQLKLTPESVEADGGDHPAGPSMSQLQPHSVCMDCLAYFRCS
jgi:hypothetical protein